MESTLTTSELKAKIKQTLGYFDFFHYPLKEEEILRYLPVKSDLSSLRNALNELTAEREVTQQGSLFAIPQSLDIFSRRNEANALAYTKLPHAMQIGKFLSKFPFVRFVGISGSLSKLYADSKSDFDYFIVTDTNRLWIARSLMHVFKKLTFLVNRQHQFCMNYYIDADHLTIEDHNRYTAIELSSLIPVYNQEVYDHLIDQNEWLKAELPNFNRFQMAQFSERKAWLKKGFERLVNLLGASKINQRLMRLTDRKWRAKWQSAGYPEQDYDLAFRTRIYVSKNHPANYQKKVLSNQLVQLSKLSPAK
ncbi:MAG: hypothetical protein EP332_04840 [Bacteroidetes bacterium]|nr:MAG: hypothetical protein EP332_04840 [Bacteroidota bacterium]